MKINRSGFIKAIAGFFLTPFIGITVDDISNGDVLHSSLYDYKCVVFPIYGNKYIMFECDFDEAILLSEKVSNDFGLKKIGTVHNDEEMKSLFDACMNNLVSR